MRTLICLSLVVFLFNTTEGWSLAPCPEDQNQRFHNCFGTFIDADGDKYVGEWKDDELHGQGTYTFASGDKYVGEWKDGLPNGQGTYTYADGDKYVGEWKDGKRQGQGTLYYLADYKFKGDIYVGEEIGGKYVGEWKDGNKHGQGTLTHADGRVHAKESHSIVSGICSRHTQRKRRHMGE